MEGGDVVKSGDVYYSDMGLVHNQPIVSICFVCNVRVTLRLNIVDH